MQKHGRIDVFLMSLKVFLNIVLQNRKGRLSPQNFTGKAFLFVSIQMTFDIILTVRSVLFALKSRMHAFFEDTREDDEEHTGRENGGKYIGGGFCIEDSLNAVKQRQDENAAEEYDEFSHHG